MNIELTDEQRIRVDDDRDIYQIIKDILSRESKFDQIKEKLYVVGLGINDRLMYIELVSLGTMYESIVEPMDVFSWALQKQVAKIVLVHNHPSENLEPSDADKDLTDRMIQVGRIVNVYVVDHLIVSMDGFYGFQRAGLLAKLERSKKYVPGFVLVDQIKKKAMEVGHKSGVKEGEEKGLKKGKKEAQVEMAKRLKARGIDIEIIAETSGLSKEEIEEIE